MHDASNEPTTQTDLPVENTEKSKRHRFRLRKRYILLVPLIALVLVVLVLGYFGFVPGVSSIMGANKPRDLGVRYTEADYQNYFSKTGGNLKDFAWAPNNPETPGKKTVFADPKTAKDLSIKQEEVTAVVNMIDWSWMPINNAQIKFSNGDVVEVSGNLQVDNIVNFSRFIGGIGYSEADINKAVDWANKLLDNPAVYIRAKTSVSKDVVSLELQEVSVGRFNAPLNIADKVFRTGSTNAIAKTPNFSAENVTFNDGTMTFSGTYPQTVYVKHD
jgi:hypothetical protein